MSAPSNPLSERMNDAYKTNTLQQENADEKEVDTAQKTNESASKQNDANDDNDEAPKFKRCPHLSCIKKKIKTFKMVQCEKCHGSGDKDDKLVFCLTCFKLNCSRNTKHAHGFNHYINTNRHNLCMMIPTFEEFNEYPKQYILDEILTIWCYKCDVFLHETEQNESPKLQKMRYEVYGCLQRGFRRISQQMKQHTKNKHKSPPKHAQTKKKNDKYDHFKNKHKQQQNNRRNNNYNTSSTVQNIEKWSAIDETSVVSLDNNKNNGYIGIFGLQNLGNTCFFNSIVQNLMETRALICALTESNDVIEWNARRIEMKDEKEKLKQSNKHKNKNKRNRNRYNNKHNEDMDKKLRGRLLTEFHKLVSNTKASKKDCLVPSGLLNAVVARNRRFSGRRQQDSHELMRVLVEGMRDQNEKMLKRDRKHRLTRNVSNWNTDDIKQWFAHYDIDIIADHLNVDDFNAFISNETEENNKKFYDKVGINIDEDKNELIMDKLNEARELLQNEECVFYCNKHQYDLDDNKDKNKNDKMNTIIDDVFGGKIQSIVTCHNCGKISQTEEEFFDLSLPITNTQKVQSYNRYNAWSKKSKKKHKKWNNDKSKKKGKKKQNKNKHIEDNNDDDNIELADGIKKDIKKDIQKDINKKEEKEMKQEIKEEQKEPKYVPPKLPDICGLDRLKKNNVELLDCLSAFTDPELLNESNKYGCKYCTQREMEEIRDTNDAKWSEIVDKYESDDIETIICERGFPLKKYNAMKQILIKNAPKILVLHLKRFQQEGYRLSKTNKKVRFGLQLNIAPYLVNNNNDNNTKCMYQLYGISVHHGSMSGGHYIAYTHKNRNDGLKNGWYYFSDSSFRSVNFEDVLRAQAYVLFYQKCDNDNDHNATNANDNNHN